MCVCDLHMYFALSSVSEIPHINRQLSIGHILFLLQLEKYQFHLCCSFTPPHPLHYPTPLSFSCFHCRCCSALSGSARRWLSALPLLWPCSTATTTTTECQELIGVQHLHTLHMCVCVCVAFVCAQLIYDISFIVIGQQLSTVLELSFCLCPLQCAL